MNWKLEVIQSFYHRENGLIQAANICAANGVTNCPFMKLHPLEMTFNDIKSFSHTNHDSVISSVSEVSPQLYPVSKLVLNQLQEMQLPGLTNN